MAKPSIPSLQDFRRSRMTRDQVRTFTYVLRAIALGRLPGEQSLSRQAFLSRALAALVMSTVLWFYVTNQENPVVRSQPYTLQVVPVHIPKGLAIRSGLTTVTVTARGLQNAVSGSQQLLPTVDLKGISSSAREANVPVTIQGGRPNVQYTSVPGTLSLRLEPIVYKTVPVAFTPQSSLPSTLEELGQTVTPNVLTISGPADQVNQVINATVTAPLNTLAPPGPDVSNFTYQFSAVPQLIDQQGHQVPSTNLLPPNTRIKVALQLSVAIQIRTLTIAPIVLPGPPLGYELEQSQPRPLTVTVFGPPDAVNTLKAISTQPINLQNVTHSMTVTTHLDLHTLPPNVFLYNPGQRGRSAATDSGPAWQVHVAIAKSVASEALPAAVKVDHLSTGLHAQTSTHWATVYVTGYYVDIAKLGSLFAQVDTTGLGPGTYDLRPTVQLPRTLANYSVSPATVHVVISRAPVSKPTPKRG